MARLRNLEEKLSVDVSEQTRLANLYAAKVENLSKILTDLQNTLKVNVKKQEDLIKDQNCAMIDQIEKMSKRVSEINNAGLEDNKANNSQLKTIINYLKKLKSKFFSV